MACHFDTRLSATLADARDNRRVLWALPRGRIVTPEGVTIDLDASETDLSARSLTWSDVVDSLTRWSQAFRIPVLREHKRNGGVEGLAAKVVALSRDEAREAGIEQPTDDALYVVAELNDDVVADYDKGGFPYMSPHIRLGYVDGAGETWPIAMPEISLTGDPRLKTQHARNLTEARLSDGDPMEERIAAIEQAIADIQATLAAMTAKTDEEPEVEIEAKDGAEMKASDSTEVAALRARVAELETQAKRHEAAALLAEAKQTREIASSVEAKFADVFVASPEHAKLLIEASPKRIAAKPTGSGLRTQPIAPTVDARLSDLPPVSEMSSGQLRSAAAAAKMTVADFIRAHSN